MQARLALLAGEAQPDALDILPDRPISIGRSRDNSVVLPQDDQASRLHARLYFEGGRWLLRDFGLNGTCIDDARVNQVAELADGNEIRIGGVRFSFHVADTPAGPAARSTTERPTSTGEARPQSSRFGPDDLSALTQFMTGAVEARETSEVARLAVQSVFYQTGAAFAGLFNIDPTDPLPKVVWPEAAVGDDVLARQLTRRVQRENRVVWLAEDTAATMPTSSHYAAEYADAIALPLKSGSRAAAALHLYKESGYFSERDRRFAEAVATFAAHVMNGHRSRRVLAAENARLKAGLTDGDELLGDSPVMAALRADLARAAAQPRPVLFHGEAGAGKAAAALEAHRRGPRGRGPFVAVRCASLPPALLEAELFGYRKGSFSGADRDHAGLAALAEDGTLYIDEVADLPTDCQAKLLRLIESRTVLQIGASTDTRLDVRVMAATRRDLGAEVAAGRLRADLVKAISTVVVTIPPLRDHAEDIPYLAQFFLDRIGAECRRTCRMTPDALKTLQGQPWPGNVRQLRCVLESTAALAGEDTITGEDLKAFLGD